MEMGISYSTSSTVYILMQPTSHTVLPDILPETLTLIYHEPLAQLPEQLSAAAERYRDLGVQGSANTKRAYAADLRSFEAYCEKHQLRPYPADLATLTSYLAHLADKPYKLATVLRHLAAIQKRHHLQRLSSAAGTPALNDVLQGITLALGKEQRQAPAFSVEHLKSCINNLDLSTPTSMRNRAILLMGFAGAFRRSELVALNIEQLRFRGDALIIHMGRSKTNQSGKAEEKALFRAENPLYCPVTAYEQWLTQLDGRQTGPVFVSMRRGRVAGIGLPSEQRLSAQSINLLVGKYLGEAAPGQPFTAHSFRSSFITTAKLAGQSNDFIRNQTNHKTDAILSRYTRLTDVVTYNASKALGL